MDDKKIKITIEINYSLYHRIQDAIKYLNLSNLYEKENIEIWNENDFVSGSIEDFLEYAEVFSHRTSSKNELKLSKQEKRIIKNTLKQYLKRHNIKQLELAEATGIERGNLSMIINNVVQPSMDAFIRIWSALNFPPLDEILYRGEADS